MSSEMMVVEKEFEDKFQPVVLEINESAVAAIPRIKFPNKDAYLAADALLTKVSGTLSTIETERKKHTQPLDAKKAEIMGFAKRFTGPLDLLKSAIRNVMSEYATAERRHVDEERRRIVEADRKAKEDERIRQAEAAQKQGLGEKIVDEILDKPVALARPIIESARAEAASSQQLTWDVDVVDMLAFVKAFAEGKVPTDSLEVNVFVLKKIVRANKGKIEWPGILITERVQIGSGR